MTQQTLEERVAALEIQVARLADLLRPAAEPGRDDWKSVVGMFGDDPIMKEIDEEARKIREKDRERASRRWKADK
jgi:hypothetical protein